MRYPTLVYITIIAIRAIIAANSLHVYIIMLTLDTTDIQKKSIGVCIRCIWSHKYVCFFTLFMYNMYLLCDHTPYPNNHTSAGQLHAD